jgi:hypothetical protein
MENIQNVLADRARTHGDFEHVAKMSQNLKHQMQSVNAYAHLDYYMAESLEQIAMKIARILSGNAFEKDHWQDIAGYATLVVRQMERVEMDRMMTEQVAEVKHQQYAARVEAPQDPEEV